MDFFLRVIPLHESLDLEWERLSQQAPFLSRGWFELSRLSKEDRIEFTKSYWLVKLSSFDQGEIENGLNKFFASLDDVGIFLTLQKEGDPYDVHMVYSLKNEAGFFHGNPPADEARIHDLEKQFAPIDFPPDYLAFLRIHDGFNKYTDTGLIKTHELARAFHNLQNLLTEEILILPDGELVDPVDLIPFYESYGLHSYQCFYADWHPIFGMGNVFFSADNQTISDFFIPDKWAENLAFPNFNAWLLFYLQEEVI